MRRKLFFAVLIWGCSLAHGQVDSTLEQQIINYQPVKPDIIAKGRSMLLDIFPEGNKQEAMQVARYLIDELESKGYRVFSPHERMLLLLWMGDYERLLFEVEQAEQSRQRYSPKFYDGYDLGIVFYPGSEDLSNVIALATAQKIDSLVWTLRASPLDADQKEFLALQLKRALINRYDVGITRDSLNSEVQTFIINHPESKYRPYVERYVSPVPRTTPKPSIFGLGFDLAPLGVSVPTGSLGRHLQPCYGLAVGLNFYFKRVVVDFRAIASFSRTRVNIPIEGDSVVWKEGLRSDLFFGGGSIGYVVLDKKKFHLFPLIGMAKGEFSPHTDDEKKYPELEDFKIESYAYSAGLCFNYFISRRGYNGMSGGWMVSLRYTCFWPQFQRKYDNYGGVVNNLTISLGGVVGRGKQGSLKK